ncbi:hypothetical protein LQW54_002636 [Pestalotiopsis sp. IQ-011]
MTNPNKIPLPKNAGRGRSASNAGSSRVRFSAMRSALDHDRSPSGPSANTTPQSVSASTSAGGPATKRPRTDSPAPHGNQDSQAPRGVTIIKSKTELAEAVQEEQTCVHWEKQVNSWNDKGTIEKQVEDMIAKAMEKDKTDAGDN